MRNKRNKRTTIYINESIYNRLRLWADRRALSVSAAIRLLVLDATRDENGNNKTIDEKGDKEEAC